MKDRGVQSRKRYLAAFLIGTGIFLLIFLLSYSLSYLEFQRITNLQGDIAYGIFEDKLDYSLFSQTNCSEEVYRQVSEDLGFQGRIIDDLENKLGKDNQEVNFRKRFYSLIELEHFEFVKTLNTKCNSNITTIFFFYSNQPEFVEGGETVGRLLEIISKRHPEDLVIYSFDVDLESELIEKLKYRYNVGGAHTLIINERDKLINPQGFLEIERYL